MSYRFTFFILIALIALSIWPNAAEASWLSDFIDNVTGDDGSGSEFNDIARNVVKSTHALPALIAAFAYLMGLLLGATGILKLKEHVDNPNNAPMRVGIIRLLAGGALFSLPIVYEAMSVAINGTGDPLEFNIEGTAAGKGSNLMGKIASLGITGDFNNLLANIIDAISEVPAVFSAFAYLTGIYLGVNGILKIKDYVEDPNKAELKEGVVRLLIGGAFLSLPNVFSAMYNAIGNGDVGFWGNLQSLLGASSFFYSSEADAYACTDITNSVGNVICNMMTATSAFPAFLQALSYVIGMIFGYWGLLKIRENFLKPQQIEAWEGISRLLVGGMFFALPYVTEVMRSTMVPGVLSWTSSGATNTGFYEGPPPSDTPADDPASDDEGGFWSTIGDIFFDGESGGACAPSGSGGLDTALTCFMADIFAPMQVALNFFAFAAGMVLIMIGISRLVESTQKGAQGPIGIGTLMTFFTGGMLLSFNAVLRAFSTSFFGNPITYTYANLTYLKNMGDPLLEASAYSVVNAVIQFMILIGLVSFVRGMFILRSAAEGAQQASVMAGITHIIGGALAVNLGPLINAVQITLGLEQVITFTG